MQKFHTILAWLLLVLLTAHLIAGMVTMLTPLVLSNTLLSYLFMALVCVHAVMALAKGLRHKSLRQTFAYFRLNRLYWVRVISGLMILILAPIHSMLWVMHTPFGALPKDFGIPSLAVQILFCGAIGVHVVLNVKPLLMDSGIDTAAGIKNALKGIAVILILLAVAAALAYFMGVGL